MNYQQKFDAYFKKFKTDPLFRRIQDNGLEEELFKNEEYFDKITYEDTYSSKKAADLLELESGKEQTLINYINRNDFNKYLNVFKQARFYRYDWESLFKFKMILLLTEHNFTPMDIASFIGTRTVFSQSEPEKMEPLPQSNKNIAEIVEKITSERIQHVVKAIKGNEDYNNQLLLLQFENQKNSQEYFRVEDKLSNLEDRLVDMEGYRSFFEATQSDAGAKPNGLFSTIFKRKNTDQEEKDNQIKIQIDRFDKKKSELLETKAKLEIDKAEISKRASESSNALERLQQSQLIASDTNAEVYNDEDNNRGLNTYDILTQHKFND